MSVSPWDDRADLASPDGRHRAIIDDGHEVAMSAPTWGTLRISNGMVIEHCNPSMVWSSDSMFLAVPQWTKEMEQRLIIVSLSHNKFRSASGIYRVLQLDGFDQGVVTGTDSPVHRPRRLEVDVSRINWT